MHKGVDFLSDLRTQILATLPHDSAASPALNQESTADLLILYMNWRSRFIMPRPRGVNKSNALIANPLYGVHAADLSNLESKIVSGQDLTPHLSRRILHGYVLPHTVSNLGQRKDLDLMLNDWNVHHLHISSQMDADGFVVRNGPLLFGAFLSDDAYLIDIFPHEAWTRDRICELIIDEWPNSGIIRAMPGVGLKDSVTETDRALLRGAGVAMPLVEYKGKVFMMGSGLTTAGTSMAATMRANYLLRAVDALTKELIANPESVRSCTTDAGGVQPQNLDLHLELLGDDRFAIEERSTGLHFAIEGLSL